MSHDRARALNADGLIASIECTDEADVGGVAGASFGVGCAVFGVVSIFVSTPQSEGALLPPFVSSSSEELDSVPNAKKGRNEPGREA